GERQRLTCADKPLCLSCLMTGEQPASTWPRERYRFPVVMDTSRRGGTRPNLSRFTDARAATAFSDPKPYCAVGAKRAESWVRRRAVGPKRAELGEKGRVASGI